MPNTQPAVLNLQLYDHLLQFPLFQGLSRSELLQMAGNTKFGFTKVVPKTVIVREGDTCQGYHFLISGMLRITTQADDHSYSFSEWIAAPWLLQPELLFGATPRYSCTITAQSDCHFITLSKDEVMRLQDDFLIIRLNLLNLLATMAQRRSRTPWRRKPANLREGIVRFMLDHTVYPAGRKEASILMTRLAQELNVSRLEVSQALNAMQADGLLRLHRGHIEIPSLEHLLM